MRKHPGGGAVQALQAALGADAVVTDDAALASVAWDGLGTERGFDASRPALPIAIIYPRTRTEVVAAVQIAKHLAVPIVPYGVGTGLMGADRTSRAGVVLDLRGMTRVREIDSVSRVVWVEAGATLKDVDAALRPHRLMVGHDPWQARTRVLISNASATRRRR